MPREKAQAAATARPKVPMRRRGADCSLVVMKRRYSPWSEGSGSPTLGRVNRQREEPDMQRKAAAFARWHEPDDASVSVRICERLGVQFPGPTRLVSRASPVQTAVRNCTRDEGGPFGFGDQVADPKPPQAAVVKSHGGERGGNAGTMIPAGTVERGERKRTVSEVSKAD